MSVQRIVEKHKPKEQVFKSLVKDFFHENPDVEKAVVSIKKPITTRSEAQNRLYWMWIDVASHNIGYNKDEIAVIFRDLFLGYKTFTTKKGKEITELRSSTELKVAEFKDYLDQIDILMAEQNIPLPRPKDVYDKAMGLKG
jgi:hypothetical protein